MTIYTTKKMSVEELLNLAKINELSIYTIQ